MPFRRSFIKTRKGMPGVSGMQSDKCLSWDVGVKLNGISRQLYGSGVKLLWLKRQPQSTQRMAQSMGNGKS